jgi:hypothetical protein
MGERFMGQMVISRRNRLVTMRVGKFSNAYFGNLWNNDVYRRTSKASPLAIAWNCGIAICP